MTIAGLDSREESYEVLIEHLEKTEISLLYETIPNKGQSKDASPETIIIKKDKKDMKQAKFGK